MKIMFEDYALGRRTAVLAFDAIAREKSLESGLSVIFVDDGRVLLFPEEVELSLKSADFERLGRFNSYDVCTVEEDGTLLRRYDDSSNENYFFVTGRCNSNCVMCPSPEAARRNSQEADLVDLINLAKHIPTDAPHLTITGGEPFLAGESIFEFVRCLKERFLFTDFLFLTNGRVFSLEKYVRLLGETIPRNSIVAIPVHGPCAAIHDSITRVDGSFEQTRLGIRNLLKRGIRVEVRVVVSRMNMLKFDEIAKLIIDQFKGVEYVSVIAMEMTGSARVNREEVWVPYRESFLSISDALRKLILAGVDVRLYNYPVCTVERPFWSLCEKSIASSKVRYAEVCEGCSYKSSCGGLFAGTFQLEKDELRAIL